MAYIKIDRKEFSGSAVKVTWDNIFSSEYENYRLDIDEIKMDTTNNLALRLIDNAGTEITGTEYNGFSWLHRSYGAPGENDSSINRAHFSLVGYSNIAGTETGKPFGVASSNMIFNPYVSDRYTALVGRDFNTGEGYDSGTTQGNGVGRSRSDFHEVQETIRGLTFTTPSGNITSLKATLYGIKI